MRSTKKAEKPKSGTDINSESAFFIAVRYHDIAVISLFNSLIIFGQYLYYDIEMISLRRTLIMCFSSREI